MQIATIIKLIALIDISEDSPKTEDLLNVATSIEQRVNLLLHTNGSIYITTNIFEQYLIIS